jgi:ribonuclease HI
MERQDLVMIVEKSKSIIEIREMLKNGHDSEGNRPSPQAWEVLKQLEAELGHVAAEWIATHSHLVRES